MMNEGVVPETPLIQALLAVKTPMVSRGDAPSGQRGKGPRVDISEVFSPPRVTEMAAKYGLKPGDAFDLTTGWDFDLNKDRERAHQILSATKPKLIIGSPCCTMFSNLQHLSGWSDKKEIRLTTAKRHLEFVCQIYKDQVDRGGWFVHEHPASASSWKERCVLDTMKAPWGFHSCGGPVQLRVDHIN